MGPIQQSINQGLLTFGALGKLKDMDTKEQYSTLRGAHEAASNIGEQAKNNYINRTVNTLMENDVSLTPEKALIEADKDFNTKYNTYSNFKEISEMQTENPYLKNAATLAKKHIDELDADADFSLYRKTQAAKKELYEDMTNFSSRRMMSKDTRSAIKLGNMQTGRDELTSQMAYEDAINRARQKTLEKENANYNNFAAKYGKGLTTDEIKELYNEYKGEQ